MDRKELTDLLLSVKPALSTNDALSEIFTHYCFDGERLLAYNGSSLGISVPFKSKFKGGVPGRVFEDLINSTAAGDVQLTMVADRKSDGGNVEIKAGKAIMTLATIPSEGLAVVFEKEFIEGKGQPIDVKSTALLAAVSCCLNSLGDDPSRVEQTGLYFRRDRQYLVVYGFNNISLSTGEVVFSGGDKDGLELPEDGVLLPGAFCKLMVEYLKADDKERPFEFEIGERFASMKSGNLNAFGTLIPQPTRIDFEKILNDNFPSAHSQHLVAIPAGLKEALERACVIINTKLDGQLRTEIDVRDGVANFFSRSQRGEVDDQVEIPGHPDVKLAIDPRPVRDALPFFATTENPGKMLFEHKCAVFSRARQTYMVAAFQPKADEGKAE